jgi:hypothetical protein
MAKLLLIPAFILSVLSLSAQADDSVHGRWEPRQIRLSVYPDPVYPGFAVGCGSVLYRIYDIMEHLDAREVDIDCDDRRSLRGVHLDVRFNSLVPAASTEAGAIPAYWEAIQFHFQVASDCILMADLFDRLSPLFSTRNFTVSSFCDGQGGTIMVNGQVLRKVPQEYLPLEAGTRN